MQTPPSLILSTSTYQSFIRVRCTRTGWWAGHRVSPSGVTWWGRHRNTNVPEKEVELTVRVLSVIIIIIFLIFIKKTYISLGVSCREKARERKCILLKTFTLALPTAAPKHPCGPRWRLSWAVRQALCVSLRMGWPLSTASLSPLTALPLRGAFPLMPREFPHLPIERTPPALPPHVASCTPDMGGHGLWRTIGSKKSVLKHVSVISLLGLHQHPTWHMNLFFPYMALRKAPYGRSSGPWAGFHPAHSDFLPGSGLPNDPPFRRAPFLRGEEERPRW